MAKKTVEYLVVISASGLDKLSKTELAFNALSEATKKQGVALDKNAKIFQVFEKTFSRGSKTFTQFTGLIDNGKKTLDAFTVTGEKSHGQFRVLGSSIKETSKTLEDFAVKSEISKLNLVALITRASLTIPVWFALRQVLSALGAIIPSIVKHAIEFESVLTQVAIVGGSTRKEISQLGTESLKVASKFGVAFEDLGSALELFAQQGFKASEISKLLGPVLQFSTVSGRKAGDVVEDLIAIQTSFNLSAEDSVTILDSISNAQLKYSINTQQLATALRKLSPVAATLGLTLQETEGFIIGVQQQTRRSGEEVATALSSIFGRLQSVDTVSNLQSLTKIPLFLDEVGKSTFEVTGRIRPVGEVISLLAKSFESLGEAERARLNVLLGGRQRFSEASALLNTYKLSIDATIDSIFAFNSTQNANNEIFKSSENNIKRLVAQYHELIDALRPATNALVNLGVNVARSQLLPLQLLAQTKVGLSGLSGISSQAGQASQERTNKLEEERTNLVKNVSNAYLNLLALQERFISDAENFQGLNIKKEQEDAVQKIVDGLNSLPKDKGLAIPVFDSKEGLDSVLEKLKKFAEANDSGLASQVQAIKELKRFSETDLELKTKIKDLEVEATKAGKSRIAIAREQLKLLNDQKALTDGDSRDLKRKLEEEIALFEIKKRDLEIQSQTNLEIQKATALGATDLQIQQLKIQNAKELFELTGDETQLLQENLKLNELIAEKIAKASEALNSDFKNAVKGLALGETDFVGFSNSLSSSIKNAFADALSQRFTDEIFQASGIGEIFGKLVTGIEKRDPIVNAHEQGGNRAAQAITSAWNGAIAKLQATLGTGLGARSLSSATGFSLPSGVTVPGGLSSLPSLNDPKLRNVLQGVRDNGSKINTTGNQSQGISGLLSNSGKFLGKGLGVAGGALSIFGGFNQVSQGGGFGNIFGGALSGALGGATIGSLFGGPIGAGIGALLGGGSSLLGLFKKPKRRVDIQEETKTFSVSSKIDITNKQLEFVNRNLIALRQDIRTYILPQSAYFSENRNSLADEFALSSTRGAL